MLLRPDKRGISPVLVSGLAPTANEPHHRRYWESRPLRLHENTSEAAKDAPPQRINMQPFSTIQDIVTGNPSSASLFGDLVLITRGTEKMGWSETAVEPQGDGSSSGLHRYVLAV